MPRIEVNGTREYTVSVPAVGERTPDGTEVTLVLRVNEGGTSYLTLASHEHLVGYAYNAIQDSSHPGMSEYAEQILAPHPLDGELVHVIACLDHVEGVQVVALAQVVSGARLYHWAL